MYKYITCSSTSDRIKDLRCANWSGWIPNPTGLLLMSLELLFWFFCVPLGSVLFLFVFAVMALRAFSVFVCSI